MESGQLEKGDLRLFLFDNELSDAEVGVIWAAPDDTCRLKVGDMHFLVGNAGKRTVRNAFLVLEIPSMVPMFLEDSLLEVDPIGPIARPSFKRTLTKTPAYTYLTYSIGDLNPGSGVGISENILLHRTTVIGTVDEIGVDFTVDYTYNVEAWLTAEDHPRVAFKMAVGMHPTRDSTDLENRFIHSHFSRQNQLRDSMSFMHRWLFSEAIEMPHAIIIRPSWVAFGARGGCTSSKPWVVTSLGM